MPVPDQATREVEATRKLERRISSLPDLGVLSEVTDPRIRRYLSALPPKIASKLLTRAIQMRKALDGAAELFESFGYSVAAYCDLEDAERDTPEWRAVKAVWDASGRGPRYILRYTSGGRRYVGVYRCYQDALEAGVETIESCSGYPEAIEMEGGNVVMDVAAILRAWEDRHEPG